MDSMVAERARFRFYAGKRGPRARRVEKREAGNRTLVRGLAFEGVYQERIDLIEVSL
jgi:hypothetical protein